VLVGVQLVRQVCFVLYLDGDVKFTSDALIDTVDGKPAFAWLRILLKQEWTQINLDQAKTGL